MGGILSKPFQDNTNIREHCINLQDYLSQATDFITKRGNTRLNYLNMKTSFVAFLNKAGIACASDTDMTL
jgi:hypothetical protein